MKTYEKKLIETQLFQFKLKDVVLKADAALLIENLFIEDLENQPEVITKIKVAKSLKEVIHAALLIKDKKFQRSFITRIWNTYIENSSLASDLYWDRPSRAIQINETETLQSGKFRNIESAQCVKFSFDHFEGQYPVFIVQVKHRLRFSKPLPAKDFESFLADRRRFYLPAYDKKKNFNCVLRSIEFKDIYFNPQKSLKNKNPLPIGELFINSGRMSKDEYKSIYTNKEKFPVAITTPYSNKNKIYFYPARDLEIVASDGLLKLENDNSNIEFPIELKESISLYRDAKSAIRNKMEERANILDNIRGTIKSIAELAEPIEVNYQCIVERRLNLISRLSVNKKVKNNQAFYCDDELEFGTNVLCYPTADQINIEGKKDKFMRFFGVKSKPSKFGIQFEEFDYTAKTAVSQPIALADHLLESIPSCRAVLVVWPDWSNLPNNKMFEFELMRRGIAVQHLINENNHKDALKIANLIKGMAEKFPIKTIRKADDAYSIAPFNYAIGLDVSRHAEEDVASFPVVVDCEGITSCFLPDTPYTIDKEKRSESEIIGTIQKVIDEHRGDSPSNILFLRDGYAYEDYDSITKELPENVTLTVVSVRKNLMSVCAEDLPEGHVYSLHSVLDDHRFVFGINARQGDNAKISRMHLAETVCNPLGIELDKIANILISLSCQNKTTETEIASLPFPIAYADRMAWTIRDMIQDNQLLKHVSDHYSDECATVGGAARFIYSELKRFVETRENGYTFAI